MDNTRPLLVVVGGFLGSGKTTLIVKAAELLHQNGKRAAVILNDQGTELVDTRLARSRRISAAQVAGGCFCCRFSELIDTAAALKLHRPDVIFAEAVGSCTDISATTLQPLKRDYADAFRLAPYTVLVDPARFREVRSGNVNADIAFLFQKQMEEADLVCITKTDRYDEEFSLPLTPIRYVSAVNCSGVAAWLDELACGAIPVGNKILAIDYEQYAKAEAGLGWLNCRFRVDSPTPLSPAMLIGPLLDRLDEELTSRGIEIVHLKVMDETPSGYLKAAVIANRQEPALEGDLVASPSYSHSILLNIRAVAEPSLLRTVVLEQIKKLPGAVEIESLQCLSPAAPKPEWRLSSVIDAESSVNSVKLRNVQLEHNRLTADFPKATASTHRSATSPGAGRLS
jgi:hypothetical protein